MKILYITIISAILFTLSSAAFALSDEETIKPAPQKNSASKVKFVGKFRPLQKGYIQVKKEEKKTRNKKRMEQRKKDPKLQEKDDNKPSSKR